MANDFELNSTPAGHGPDAEKQSRIAAAREAVISGFPKEVGDLVRQAKVRPEREWSNMKNAVAGNGIRYLLTSGNVTHEMLHATNVPLYDGIKGNPIGDLLTQARNGGKPGIDTSRLGEKELKEFLKVVELANAKDKNGSYVNPELHMIYDRLNTSGRTFFVENRGFGDKSGTIGEFHITEFEGKNNFRAAVIQLDFKKARGLSTTTAADLVPGFEKFGGLTGGDEGSAARRLAELFGHEGAHGVYALNNPADAVKLQGLLNERDAAMKAMPKGTKYPYPSDVMQKMKAASKALTPTERYAQEREQIINEELRRGRTKGRER